MRESFRGIPIEHVNLKCFKWGGGIVRKMIQQASVVLFKDGDKTLVLKDRNGAYPDGTIYDNETYNVIQSPTKKHYIANMVIGVHIYADSEAEAADVVDSMHMSFIDVRDRDELGTVVIDKELAVVTDLIGDDEDGA